MKKYLFSSFAFCAALALVGCQAPYTNNMPAPQETTLGTVQKAIHKGMTQDEVVAELGAPNMVSRDKEGLEVWVYDKASTVVTSSGSSSYGTLILVGASAHQSASSISQKSLTLILKFKDAVLSEYSYRYSTF